MDLRWLEKSSLEKLPVSWGIPWAKGELSRETGVIIEDEQGKARKTDYWPMAYWPDGSVKWSGHAGILDGSLDYRAVKTKTSTQVSDGIKIHESLKKIVVSNGSMSCTINKYGKNIIENLVIEDRSVSNRGSLILVNERRNGNIREELLYESEIQKVSVEKKGAVRSVILVEGVHERSSEKFMPFKLRLVFFRGENSIKLVHTLLYDADKERDFIKGVGIKFSASLKGDEFNRHVGYSLEKGMYTEAGKLLLSRFFRYGNKPYEEQIKGKIIRVEDTDEKIVEAARNNASWNDFKLIQDSADHYKIVKRKDENLAYVDILHGKRPKGLMYVGGEEGGLALGIKDFWKKYPSALEVKNLLKDESEVILWLWDPSAEPMDMRHYSDTYHMSAYEGFQEVRSSPIGIANTSVAYIQGFSAAPEKRQLEDLADLWQRTDLLVCQSKDYRESGATGIWSLPKEKPNTLEEMIEGELQKSFEFYRDEIEQRRWYGYWNYGDIMHTYDGTRNQWMYDMGGYAWQNTELMPNVWLWYQFFRSGNPEIFKMAEAMTRHNSEVDCYHLGEYKGLGSRHNVVHWGCSCKEARINMTLLYKYYYYLTCDERTGELLSESVEVDQSVKNLKPLRGFFPEEEDRTHVRTGPDWSAYCSNWHTEWERTEDERYKEWIDKGMDYLKSQPLKLLAGPAMRYNCDTKELEEMDSRGKGEYHMMISFGAPQIWMEIAQDLEDSEWKEILADFGEFYALSDEEKLERSAGILKPGEFHWPQFATAMIAFAAKEKEDEGLARKAWKLLFEELEGDRLISPLETKSWQNLVEDKRVTTNCVAQWCLNTMVCLELIGNTLNDL